MLQEPKGTTICRDHEGNGLAASILSAAFFAGVVKKKARA